MAKLYWLKTGLRLGKRHLDKHQLVQLDHIKPEVMLKLLGSALIEVGTLPLTHYPLLKEHAILLQEFGIETLADYWIAQDDTSVQATLFELLGSEYDTIYEQVECDIIPHIRDK